MDGELRLVSRVADPTDPLAKLKVEVSPSVFLGAGCYGRHSFGYFSVAADRKVTRQWGETHALVSYTNRQHNKTYL